MLYFISHHFFFFFRNIESFFAIFQILNFRIDFSINKKKRHQQVISIL